MPKQDAPTPPKKETIQKGKKNKAVSTQRYLEFAGVHDDTLILKDGGIRAVLGVSSVNFSLKSEEEQNAIIFSFQRFLNSLDFPIQILTKSRKLDIDHYINDLKKRKKDQKNPLLQAQMDEYIEYIQKLVEYSDIMEKKFYIVVAENPLRAEKTGFFRSFLKKIAPDDTVGGVIQRKREFARLKKGLDTKINVVETGLSGCGLHTKRLKTEELIQVFYQCYNPEEARTEKLEHFQDLAVEESGEEKLIPDGA